MYLCGRPGNWPDPEYVVRAKNPAALISGLRATIREIDATRAVFSVRPLSEAVAAAIEQPRIGTGLTAGFAAAAMLLAGTGLYGLFALVVAETRREMGVRLALGAAPRQLARFVCARAGRLLIVGILIGFGLTAGAGRWLQALLFGIGAFDVLALAGTMLTVTLVSAIAIAIPAFRAAHVLPSEALRGD
jgi:ABC-type antimicrobial peptide transport system permease subunit